MKTIYIKVISAAVALAAMISCNDAGAENRKEKDSKKHMDAVTELTAADFSTKVYDMSKEELHYSGSKPAIIDFYATWCGPCQKIAPILAELAKEYEDEIVIYKVDIDKAPELAKAFNIRSIPAIMYIPSEGTPVITIGARDKGRFRTEIDTILLGK